MTLPPRVPPGDGDPFPAELWTPLERPSGDEQVVPITRHADALPPAAAQVPVAAPAPSGAPTPTDSTAHSGGPSPLVWSTDRGLALVRFRHHAPAATAVALQANGWWRPEPRDACDLRSAADGWWEGTFEVPGDWRASYGFCEFHGEGDPPWWDSGLKRTDVPAVPDVTNPRSHRAARGGQVRSVVSVPDDGPFAAGSRDDDNDDTTSAPGTSATVLAPTLSTLRTGPTEPVARWWASRPGDPGCANLDPREPLPLLIVTDGRQHTDLLGTPTLIRRGVATGLLPPLAAVFIESGPRRDETLGVPGGQAQWIAEHLVPRLRIEGLGSRGRADDTSTAQVDTRLGGISPVTIDPDPARTVVTGSSFGGLTALFVVSRAPGVIGTAIAQSVSLWRYPAGALAEPLIRATAGHRVRLSLHAGRFEGTMPTDARTLVDSLTNTGVDATLAVHSGGHDWAWWQPAMLWELSALLR